MSAIVLAVLSQPAGAAKAKPKEKLYTISLATTVQVATTESRAVRRRARCRCSNTATPLFRLSRAADGSGREPHRRRDRQLGPGPNAAGFLLFPNPKDAGRFTLTYEASEIIRECPPINYPIPGFFDGTLIPVQVSSVLALRKHRNVHAAGTISKSMTGALTSDPIGKETLTYAIKITRVR